jgi:hypothetical protein
MPDRSRLLGEVERLRVVVALQYLHARHGLMGANRTNLDELWQGAHNSALLPYVAGGDPAVLVSLYLTEAMHTADRVVRNMRGAQPHDVMRVLRDRGLGNISKLREAMTALRRAGGDRPADGWGVPYVPWRDGQRGEPRTVKLGGSPERLARKVEAARALSPGQLEELSPAELVTIARGLGLDLAVSLGDYRQRAQVAARLSETLLQRGRAPAAATTSQHVKDD